jgi:hypothetical protein
MWRTRRNAQHLRRLINMQMPERLTAAKLGSENQKEEGK